MQDKTIKPIFWLWLPFVWVVIQLLAEISLPHDILARLHEENGPHELLQVGLLLAGFVVAFQTFLRMNRKTNPWLSFYIALAAFCCLIVAIEEMSWGQTLFKWGTPEGWAEINNQRETNIHNTSKWFNQKPRFLLEIGILIGGIILPLLQQYKPSWVPKRFEIIYAPQELFVTAMIALIVKLIDKGGKHYFEFDFFTRPSEVGELYLFYFVLFYLITLKRRLTA